MRSTRRTFVLTATLTVLLSQTLPVDAESQPAGNGSVKVFILAGQSNMVGDGRLGPADTKGTLANMVQKYNTQDRFKHLVDEDGNWDERDDVWYFQRQTA